MLLKATVRLHVALNCPGLVLFVSVSCNLNKTSFFFI